MYCFIMIVTISGNAGSGKSTVSKIIAEKLNLKRYYIGGIRRETARKKGMTLEEYNQLGEKDPSTDKEIDDYQRDLGLNEDNFIIEGRTSYHFIPNSIKIFVKVSNEVGAERIWKDLLKNADVRNEAKVSSIDELKKSLVNRQKSDEFRYQKYYKINPFDESNYDLVIDTSNMTVSQVALKILEFLAI